MTANRCPNPSCELFNRVLPNNAKICPMCGTPLGNVVTPSDDRVLASEKQLAKATPDAKSSATSPAERIPAPAPQPVLNPPVERAPAPPQPVLNPPVERAPAPPQPVLNPPVERAPAPPQPVVSLPAEPVPTGSSHIHTPSPHSNAQPTLKLIHTSGKEFRLRGEEGYIGRQSPVNPVLPEIDLSGISNEGIVSRSHARVYWDKSQNVYMLVDNNSRNGTYLNEKFLSPGIHYPLKDKDVLQLGQEKLVCFTVLLTNN
ncbi:MULTISPECIES: FHA domain-containing protein [Nostocales]|uniref:FHA domain-containing protein n=3 Tax=Nostocales TaxID=1161 RepID=A0A0C1QP67_9CYAN|nr:FHA domain-containing protein [Tolypothrix bouteillei]KAF3889229.1 FHA domain-containing protein [Tolypothrix bouteillei VB521301]